MDAAKAASSCVSHSQPQSPISEAFRALRTSLLLSQADRPPQVILVTSPLPREGKDDGSGESSRSRWRNSVTTRCWWTATSGNRASAAP